MADNRLSREKRRIISKEINDIFEHQCRGCKFEQKGGGPKGYCATQCYYGIKLKELGDMLSPNSARPKKEVPKAVAATQKSDKSLPKDMAFSIDNYIKLKKQGYNDQIIASVFNISGPTLSNRLKEAGISGKAIREEIRYQMYIELINDEKMDPNRISQNKLAHHLGVSPKSVKKLVAKFNERK